MMTGHILRRKMSCANIRTRGVIGGAVVRVNVTRSLSVMVCANEERMRCLNELTCRRWARHIITQHKIRTASMTTGNVKIAARVTTGRGGVGCDRPTIFDRQFEATLAPPPLLLGSTDCGANPFAANDAPGKETNIVLGSLHAPTVTTRVATALPFREPRRHGIVPPGRR